MFAKINQKPAINSQRKRRKPTGDHVPLNVGNFYVPIDSDDFLSKAEKQMRQDFLTQVQEAFANEPTLGGVVHGQRKIRLGKEGSRSSYFPSLKNARGGKWAVYLPVESRVEARYALELERDKSVAAFRTQSIQLNLPGMNRPVFPDFTILSQAGRLLLREVKADLRFASPDTKARIEYLRHQLGRYGIEYDAVDAFSLPSDKKYDNLKWLYQQISEYPPQEEIAAFLQHPFICSTYGELRDIAASQGLSPSVVPYLLFVEAWFIDWTATVTDQTEVRK